MRNYDLTPLYRSAIGFDRLAQLAEHAAANNVMPATRHTISSF